MIVKNDLDGQNPFAPPKQTMAETIALVDNLQGNQIIPVFLR